jgi:RimJ/RimL family protein N-acetyltransferase
MPRYSSTKTRHDVELRIGKAAPMGNAHWPLFDLEVRTPDVTLRYPDDDTLVALVRLAAEGVHDPDDMPFAVPWTRFDSPQLEQEALRFHWLSRAETRPDSFRIPLAVFRGEELLGASEVGASNFAALRRFETGSWLGQQFQGQGVGKQMRRATLACGFDGLGGTLATTTAWHDNPASLGVTRSLGYTEQGRERRLREGVATDLFSFDMEPEHFESIRPDGVEFFGLDSTREFLGLS